VACEVNYFTLQACFCLMPEKKQTALFSVFSNFLLIVMKVAAGIVSGSVSILSEAIHSLMDLIASLIAFFSVRYADNPPDREHPYGHGKLENVSGVIEALLIAVAAGWIIYEAAGRLMHPRPLEKLGWAIVVMGISAVVNFFVARRLYRTARRTDSVALKADGLHLMTDVYTSAGVMVGLALVSLFSMPFLDSVVAIAVAVFILFKSFGMFRESFLPLIDTGLTDEEVSIIHQCVHDRNLSYHDLKTRQAGSFRFAEFHLELSGKMPLDEVHAICDELENDIKSRIRNLNIIIHVEPLNGGKNES